MDMNGAVVNTYVKSTGTELQAFLHPHEYACMYPMPMPCRYALTIPTSLTGYFRVYER